MKIAKNLKQNVYANVYSMLWFLALLGAGSSYIDLQTTKLKGTGLGFAIAFGIVTLGQQFTVYMDLEHPDAKRYGPWIGTWPEILLRYGIAISLLFGVGKIATVIYPLSPEVLLGIGSVFAFVFLLIWNSVSLSSLLGNRPTGKSCERRVHFLNCFRVGIFIGSLLCGLIYWFTALMGSARVLSDVSMVFFLVYACLIIVLYLLRSRRISKRILRCLLTGDYEWSLETRNKRPQGAR